MNGTQENLFMIHESELSDFDIQVLMLILVHILVILLPLCFQRQSHENSPDGNVFSGIDSLVNDYFSHCCLLCSTSSVTTCMICAVNKMKDFVLFCFSLEVLNHL